MRSGHAQWDHGDLDNTGDGLPVARQPPLAEEVSVLAAPRLEAGNRRK
ncbi:MAG: hypothetical protein ACOC1F_14280 [Myxococcota bacterium]